MVTRNGQPAEHTVPGFAGRLTRSELDAYESAFRTIRSEYREVEKIQEQLDRLGRVKRWDEPNPSPFDVVVTPDSARWNVCGVLLKLSRGDVLLCRREAGTEWAAIQRFEKESPYAQAHGKAEILLTGSNAREVGTEYLTEAQHTARFMASNLVAQAQAVVWDRYSNANPHRVMHAISERCAHVVKNTEVVREVQSVKESVTQASRRSRSIRV
jgi:hypothetical protein